MTLEWDLFPSDCEVSYYAKLHSRKCISISLVSVCPIGHVLEATHLGQHQLSHHTCFEPSV